MTVSMQRERSKDTASTLGLMEPNTKVSGPATTFKAKAYISGLTGACIMVNGEITTSTAMERRPGQMAAGMKATTKMIKCTEKAATSGLMAESTRVNGNVANSTVREN